MNPKLLQQPITDEFIEKTIKEVRNNIARREEESFGQGLFWAAIAVWLSMALSYALGDDPGPWNVSGVFIVGLWYRFRKRK